MIGLIDQDLLPELTDTDDPQEKAQKWLSKSTKSEFLHAEATRIATPGTGAWFIQSDYFSKWIIEHSILWLFGPGKHPAWLYYASGNGSLLTDRKSWFWEDYTLVRFFRS